MMNMEIYDKLKQPPDWAKKAITGGRLKGKTDINPQWRYQAMTEQFGMCGIGWMYEIKRLWIEPAANEQVFAFAEIKLYVKNGDDWSVPIPGIGGNMLVDKDKNGLYCNDEAYKMAVTDALSVAMKMLGVGAEVYSEQSDGSKYDRTRDNAATPRPTANQDARPITDKQLNRLYAIASAKGFTAEQIKSQLKTKYSFDKSTNELPRWLYD